MRMRHVNLCSRDLAVYVKQAKIWTKFVEGKVKKQTKKNCNGRNVCLFIQKSVQPKLKHLS